MDITSEIDGAAALGLAVTADYDGDAESPRGDEAWCDEHTALWFAKRAGGVSDAWAGAEFSFGWDDFRDFASMARAMRKASPGVEILPVYTYQHSGVAYNTTGFACPWDSGLAGLIYITAPAMRTRFLVKRLTNSIRVRMREGMRAEVETYAAWANGETYYVTVKNVDGDVLESVGGAYGWEAALELGRELVGCQRTEAAA